MVVGGALWNLGVFDFGGAAAPTASGFSVLKPLLPSCSMAKGMYLGSGNGFECQFMNAAGADIALYDVSMSTNGGSCTWQWVLDGVQDYSASSATKAIYRSCAGGVCSGVSCYSMSTHVAIPCPVVIARDQTFTVYHFDWVGSGTGDVCDTIDGGGVYETLVELEYEVDLGGVAVRKREAGVVRQTAD